jgi:hypothetical protein
MRNGEDAVFAALAKDPAHRFALVQGCRNCELLHSFSAR